MKHFGQTKGCFGFFFFCSFWLATPFKQLRLRLFRRATEIARLWRGFEDVQQYSIVHGIQTTGLILRHAETRYDSHPKSHEHLLLFLPFPNPLLCFSYWDWPVNAAVAAGSCVGDPCAFVATKPKANFSDIHTCSINNCSLLSTQIPTATRRAVTHTPNARFLQCLLLHYSFCRASQVEWPTHHHR